MKTIAVYVLTSQSSDYYLEQLIISVYSLRLYNPEMKIFVVVDNETNESLVNDRSIIKEYVSEVIAVNTPAKYDNLQKSRYLKTTLRSIIDGDYLFIDTDTVITDNIRELDSLTCSVGAVLDKHVCIKDHSGRNSIIHYAKLFDWEIPNEGNYFNSGIMYVKDDSLAHKVYESWHACWKKGLDEKNISIDQPSLAKANEINGYPIAELSGIYNCQIIENGLKYLLDAKIIHYFASNTGRYDCPYIFRNPKIYEKVRKTGIDGEIELLLEKPKSAFLSKCTIIGGNQCDIYSSPMAGIARRLSLKFPSLNLYISKLYRQ